MTGPLRLAVRGMGGDHWIAGFTLTQNLLGALWRHAAAQVETLWLADAYGRPSDPLESLFDPEQVLRDPPGSPSIPGRWPTSGPGAFPLEDLLLRHRVDAVFGLALAMRSDRVATLSLIPDFQHLHLPQMFTPEERRRRDEWFAQSAALSTRVILLSESVARDFRHFAPRSAHKARALFPPPDIPDAVYRIDPRVLADGLGLPPKFLYFPGQFWKHKNHARLLDAVRVAGEHGVRIHVVCTGHPHDARWPAHGPELLQRISAPGLREQITCLGLLPREDVLGLMRRSAAVINPSLFEGWGMSVDEARSLGKRLAISDIAAHRDQDPASATYFDPVDVADMAAKLSAVWASAWPGPDPVAEEAARAELEARQRAFAVAFVDLVRDAVGSKVGNAGGSRPLPASPASRGQRGGPGPDPGHRQADGGSRAGR